MKRQLTMFALAVVAVVGSIPFVQKFVQADAGIAVGNQCSPEEKDHAEASDNPNRALFVSCGGFL